MKFKRLDEGKSRLNISAEDRNVLKVLLSQKDNLPTQESLRKYLCKNRLHRKDDPTLIVHHIDGNHDNYEDSNLVLLPKEVHNGIHSSSKIEAIDRFLTELGYITELDRDSFDLYDFLTQKNINRLWKIYEEVLREYVEPYLR